MLNQTVPSVALITDNVIRTLAKEYNFIAQSICPVLCFCLEIFQADKEREKCDVICDNLPYG